MKVNLNKELYIVDDNGEVVDVIKSEDSYVKLSEGDRVLRKNTVDYLKKTIDVKYHFVKVNPKAYWQVAKKYPIFNKFLDYVGYMDGILIHKNGRLVQLKDIHKICDVSQSTAKRQIRGLIKDDVIHKIKDPENGTSYLIVNPWICMCGKKINISLYDEFKSSSWRNECEVRDN